MIDSIALASGQSGLNYDFGELLPASVSGYVYVDANDNGAFDPGETPIAGVTVTLLNASGQSTGETATTDSSGYYQFNNLTPGRTAFPRPSRPDIWKGSARRARWAARPTTLAS